MNMNMRIVIDMNIYITRDNEEWLRNQDRTMSGIINELLEKARGASPVQVAGETFAEELEKMTGKPTRYNHQPMQRNARATTLVERAAGKGESVELPPTPIKCKGDHFMSRKDCGKPGCPWA